MRIPPSIRTGLFTLVVCLALLAGGPGLERARGAGFSDAAVARAIQKGQNFLWSKQGKGGNWRSFKVGSHHYPAGHTALIVYALLESGVNPQETRMARAMDWLVRQKTHKTYSLAMLCSAFEVANRTTRGKYRKHLARCAARIWQSSTRGGYDYDCDGKAHKRFDNSNTQFALLGVWAAARDNIEVPLTYWNMAMRHWARTQFDDGTWGYYADRKTSKPTMTAGGIASMFICFDHVYAGSFDRCRGGLHYPPIRKGLAWLEKNFARTLGGAPNYYYYYGLERVALASGYKYFGTHDWYKLGAPKLVAAQRANGSWPPSWGSEEVSTAFALLFLIRGQNPVLFNKLQYKGYWSNRPRDLANLTQWLSRTFERTLNWQIINLNTPVREWHDAPILYIAGSRKPEFREKDLAKLREFVLQGGTIFSVSECGQKPFPEAMREIYQKLFPAYKLRELPRDHVFYTKQLQFELPAGRPRTYMVSNGIRPLVIHMDQDVSHSWQGRRWATETYAFHAAANVAKYITGLTHSLRHRGTSHWPEAIKVTPKRTMRLTRVRHRGNWDPEPLAMTRFARLLAQRAQIRLQVTAADLDELPKSRAGLAHLTGTESLKLYGASAAAIRKFVEGGGTLLVDVGGGRPEFADTMREFLEDLYPDTRLRNLSADHAIYQIPGMEIKRARYRTRTDQRLGNRREPNLYALLVDGRPAVLYSREDIIGSLIGTPSYTIDGYEPESAYEVLRNALVFAGNRARQPEDPMKTAPGLKYTYLGEMLTPSTSGVCGTFDPGSARKAGQAALRLTGYVNVPRRGGYVFTLAGPSKAKLYLGTDTVATHAGSGETRSESIELAPGKHAVTLTVMNPPGDKSVNVLWEGPGLARQPIPASALFHELK